MRRFSTLAMLAACAWGADQPPASVVQSSKPVTAQSPEPVAIHRGRMVDFTSVPAGMVMGPTKCDDSGAVYFRQYKPRDVYGAAIVKLDPRENRSLVINVSSIGDSSVAKAPTLRFVDFTVNGGAVYVAATNEDAKAYILKFSAGDGSFQSAISLEEKFYPMKIAAFNSGALLVAGVKTTPKPDSTSALQNDTVLIDRTGVIAKHLNAGDWGDTKGDQAVDHERLDALSMSLMEGAGTSAYLIQSSAATTLAVVGDGGTVEPPRKLRSPGEDYSAFNLRASGTSILVEYVKDLKSSGTVTEFVLYDLSLDQPVQVYRADADVGGALGCYDGRDGFTFVNNHGGHTVLMNGSLN